MKTEITVKIVVDYTSKEALDFCKKILKVDKPSNARGGSSMGRFRVESMEISEEEIKESNDIHK